MKKVTAIICGKNPRAAALREEIELNLLPHFQLVTYITKKNTATQIARDEALKGTDVILAVGGDGTVNEVVNGLVFENSDISKLPAVAVIPFGTGNDLSRTINAGYNYKQLIEKINNDDYIIADVASASYTNHEGKPESRYFINIADIGLGPSVITKAEKLAKKINGTMSYMLSAVATLFSPPKMNIRLITDDFRIECPMSIICVANGIYFGSGFGISPYSKIDDGLLDIVYIKKLTTSQFVSQIKKIRQSKLVFADQVSYRKTDRCRIESIGDKEMEIELDGELVGTTPIDVKIFSSSIKLFVDTK
ncbi:MAG: diacylglycerol kinase family lipid kinase [Bacteroidales bacterium]|nr:diacylglycerol kinase family lipid kinase [Bacteroidales bacterium]